MQKHGIVEYLLEVFRWRRSYASSLAARHFTSRRHRHSTYAALHILQQMRDGCCSLMRSQTQCVWYDDEKLNWHFTGDWVTCWIFFFCSLSLAFTDSSSSLSFARGVGWWMRKCINPSSWVWWLTLKSFSPHPSIIAEIEKWRNEKKIIWFKWARERERIQCQSNETTKWNN